MGQQVSIPFNAIAFPDRCEVYSFMLPGGNCKGHTVSQPSGSGFFAPCPCGSLPYFYKQLCFPRTGVSHPLQSLFALFIKEKKSLSLYGLTEVYLSFIILKLPVRGKEKRRIERWWGLGIKS
jgi:hypothetical protein